DGKKLWSFGSGNGCLFAGVGNGAVYAETDFALCALGAADGNQLWAVPADLISNPVASGGAVYVSGGQGSKLLLWALRASDGAKIWDLRGGGKLAIGRNILCGNSWTSPGLAAWRKSDGKQLWNFAGGGQPV